MGDQTTQRFPDRRDEVGVREQSGRRESFTVSGAGWVVHGVAGGGETEREVPEWFKPPSGYTVHAELIIEGVPVDAALLMENLLDLAHAPFTHTGTFAKGWGVQISLSFATKQLRKPGDGWHDMATFLSGRSGPGIGYSAEGSWKPYPIDMKFITPCMVDSHIGMAQLGCGWRRRTV